MADSLMASASNFIADNNFTPGELQAILTSALVMSILSLIGCVFNLTVTMALKIHHHVLGMMIVWLSLMDFIYNTVGILQTVSVENSLICQVQSFAVSIGYGGSLAWSCCFAHSLYINFKKDDIRAVATFYKRYVKICILIAIMLATVSLVIRPTEIDNDSHTCWPKRKENSIDWAFVSLEFIPSTTAAIYCLICYFYVIKKVRRFGGRMYLELLVYPLIMIVCYSPFNILRLYVQITGVGHGPFWWELSSIVFANSQGIFNALAYGLSGTLKGGCQRFCQRKNGVSDDSNQHSISAIDTEFPQPSGNLYHNFS